MNGEAISETDWGSFQSLKERKTKRLGWLEVGISIKGHRDQIGKDLGTDIFFGLKRTFADLAWMLSLVSYLRFVEEVRNIPRLHFIL